MPQFDHAGNLGIANGIATLDGAAEVPLAQLPGSAGRKDHLVATVNPTVNNDTTEGYAIGSVWLNLTADTAFICLDATDTAAIWKETTAGAGGGESNTASNVGDGADIFKQKAGVNLEFRGVKGVGLLASTVNGDNVEVSFADHSTKVGNAGDITTTSSSMVLATGMTITPVSGTYLVWWGGPVTTDTNGNSVALAIFSGGTIEADSEQNSSWDKADFINPVMCIAKVTVNGSEAIEGRWFTVGGGTAKLFQRALMILRVA